MLLVELIGADITGADGARPDATAGQLMPEDLGKPDERKLAHTVRGIGWPSEQPKLRSDKHDPPVPTLEHSREYPLGQPQRRPHVHPIALLEILDADVPDKVTPKDPGVADQNIHRPKRILNLVNRAYTLSSLSYIRRDGAAGTIQVSHDRR